MISIHSSPLEGLESIATRPKLSSKFDAVLFLHFDDVEEEEYWRYLWRKEAGQNPRPMALFTEDMASDIFDFVEMHQHVKVINVHCDAGVSRSVAVGLVIAEEHGWELETKAVGTIDCANGRVKRVMHKQLWFPKGMTDEDRNT